MVRSMQGASSVHAGVLLGAQATHSGHDAAQRHVARATVLALALGAALGVFIGAQLPARFAAIPPEARGSHDLMQSQSRQLLAAASPPLVVDPYPDSQQKDSCAAYLGAPVTAPLSVILNADPGDFSGTPEAHYFIANLQNKVLKPRNDTVCGLVYHGTLMGQPVMAVTTGIGPTAAAVCVQELLTACGTHIKEFLFSGTSGWSSQLGGVLNPPQCSSANQNQVITRLGDVCVSPFSVNWGCKLASWTEQAKGYPNQCFRPIEENGPNATFLFGNCEFYTDNVPANLQLSEEVMHASKTLGANAAPARPAKVQDLEKKYYTALANATGARYPLDSNAGPTIWDYTKCMEADSHFFFSGIPFEVKARDYIAAVLAKALKKPYSSADVIAVSAMEGVGVSEIMEKYNRLSTTKQPIPYTYVRAMSDWLHQGAKKVKPGLWEDTGVNVNDFPVGYGYAIATGSTTILSVYQNRCKQDVASHKLAKDFKCTFTINYSG